MQGRNGVSSPDPYTLTVSSDGGSCKQRLEDYTGDAGLGAPEVGKDTVILTDPARMAGTAEQKAALADQLAAFAKLPSVNGTVIDLGRSQRITRLNAQADASAHIDCPYAKNLVAEEIRHEVNRVRDAGPVKYVVVVGADSVVPFFRYPDAAGIGPESSFVPPVADQTASQASLRGNYVLGQDAYGSRTDVAVKGSEVPVPDLPVGRLVQSPSEIGATLQRYLDRSGAAIMPASSLATGYDFLSDAATSVADDLQAGIEGTANDRLITRSDVPPSVTTKDGVPSPDTSWTADDLSTQLKKRHDLMFLAGHFSANDTLAADYRTKVNSAEIAAAPDGLYDNTLVFSAGCHSGYTIVDGERVKGVTADLDWTRPSPRRGRP